MSNRKRSIRVITILLFLSFTSISISLSAEINENLKDKIRKAKSFDDIFKLEKIIKLESAKGCYISRINTMVMNANGDLIINNMGSSGANVYIFNKKGNFIKEIGRKGNGPGEYDSPRSLCQDSFGDIYVVDPNKRRIIVYSHNYKYKRNINYSSNNQHIHINSKNDIFLYMGAKIPIKKNYFYMCIAKLNSEGKKIYEFAQLPKEIMDLELYANHDCLAIDKNDFIYEANPLLPNIRKYDSNGKFIKEFGSKYVKMIPEKGNDGKIHEYPRTILSYYIYDDIIMMMFDDNKMDCYDLEGNLLNKDIKIDKRIVCSTDKEIFLVDQENEQNNPILHKYVVKQ